MFSNVMGMLSGKKQQLANEDVDEQHLVQQHNNFFGGGGGGGGNATSGNMGVSFPPYYSDIEKLANRCDEIGSGCYAGVEDVHWWPGCCPGLSGFRRCSKCLCWHGYGRSC
jgi:hypothetical protein